MATRPAIAPLAVMPMSNVFVIAWMATIAPITPAAAPGVAAVGRLAVADRLGAGGEAPHRPDPAGGGPRVRAPPPLGEAPADRAQRRPGVEAEPAEPQDDHRQPDQRHRVTRDDVRR